MIRFNVSIMLLLALLISASPALAQVAKIGIVDFERAVVESAEGKQSQAKWDAKLVEKQKEVEKRRKELEGIQTKLQTQEKVLSDAVKSGLQRDLERGQTELTRISEDAQKELETLRNDLLQPIAQRASAVFNAMAAEMGFTLVIDVSNPQNNVLWHNPANDVTAELIRRIDASAPKPAAAAPAKPPAAPPKP
jgi:Skp family chaperone for outer membrane proteins